MESGYIKQKIGKRRRNKLKTLYLMRHGQTLFNQLERKQGWCDSPLTELGIKQAIMAGKYFKEKNQDID